jgi:hypothetical protein
MSGIKAEMTEHNTRRQDKARRAERRGDKMKQDRTKQDGRGRDSVRALYGRKRSRLKRKDKRG